MLNEGDKNTKLFHNLASAQIRANKISMLKDCDNRLDNRDEIIDHITIYCKNLYSKEVCNRPLLDYLDFNIYIEEHQADWLERSFEEGEGEVEATIS